MKHRIHFIAALCAAACLWAPPAGAQDSAAPAAMPHINPPPPLPHINPPPPLPGCAEALAPLLGQWGWQERAGARPFSMEIAPGKDECSLAVQAMWPQSPAALYYWQFSVHWDAASKSYPYTGARHWHEPVMAPDGEALKRDVKYEDGSGALRLEGGTLLWDERKEGICTECRFTKEAPPPAAAPRAELSLDEASRIVQDSFTIWLYVGVKDEADYAKPENIIRAALFGAYDARAGFNYEQAMKKDKGEAPAPLSTPLFSVGGRSVAAQQVVLQEDKPALFKGLPTVKMEWGEASYNVHLDRQTVALAALRFTGRAVTRHTAPKGVHLNEAGYFMLIDGLGSTGREPQLARVEPRGTGYVLSGTLKNEMDDGQPDESFRLSIAPGDAPGTWRREALTLTPLKSGAKN